MHLHTDITQEELFRQYIRLALSEDLMPNGDLTTDLFVEKSSSGIYYVASREQPGIMSGNTFCDIVFDELHKIYNNTHTVNIEYLVKAGHQFTPNTPLVKLSGAKYLIITGERLFLNILQRAISIATYTQEFVQKMSNTKVQLLDTRKTTPGLRLLERQAVLDGGGNNHRYNLSSSIMIKDNHISQQNLRELLLLKQAELQKLQQSNITIELEIDTFEQLQQIIDLNFIDIVMLDNFAPSELAMVIDYIHANNSHLKIECSGGINLSNILEYAQHNIDYISVGCLTYAPPIIDIGSDF